MQKTDLGAALGFIHVMRRDENRDAVVAQLVEQIPHLLPVHRIEPGGGFIEKKQRRFVDQRAPEREQLPHPARKTARRRVALRLQVHLREQPLDPRLHSLAEPGRRRQKSAVLEHRQVRIETELLRHVAKPRPHRVRGLCQTSAPSIVALPDVGRTSPQSIRIVVVLPAPFAPRNPKISPRLIWSERSHTARDLRSFSLGRQEK